LTLQAGRLRYFPSVEATRAPGRGSRDVAFA